MKDLNNVVVVQVVVDTSRRVLRSYSSFILTTGPLSSQKSEDVKVDLFKAYIPYILVSPVKMATALTHTSLPKLRRIAQGKVRDIYSLPDEQDADKLLFVATDRISAFDIIMENVSDPLWYGFVLRNI
jgi:hypothetical protein